MRDALTTDISYLDDLDEIERQNSIAVNSHDRPRTKGSRRGLSPNIARASVSREKKPQPPAPATDRPRPRYCNWHPKSEAVNVFPEQLIRTIITPAEIRAAIVVRSMSEMVAGFRASRAERNVTCETVDNIAGWHSGYCAKVITYPPIKNLGWQSLGEGFGALGKMLLLVDDPDAIARVKDRWIQRQRPTR